MIGSLPAEMNVIFHLKEDAIKNRIHVLNTYFNNKLPLLPIRGKLIFLNE